MNHPMTWWGTFPDFQQESFPDYPLYVGDPVPDPNRVGDFPLKKSQELFWHPHYPSYVKESNGCWSLNRLLKETTVWFNQIDGGQKFVLELAGYSKEQVSAKIINGILTVGTKRTTIYRTNDYRIPSVETLDLERFSVTMKNGLLEISFPPKKKDAPKTIVIL